jgi:uncharacterized protein (TIGR02099 family)
MNREAREWMAKGLVDGQIHDARLVLRGDLDAFPFEEQPGQGDFALVGHYTGGIIDPLPASKNQAGWPRLTDISGKASLHRADLRLDAEQAKAWPTEKQSISLSHIKARIPDLEHESILEIQGDSTAPAEAYVALVQHSPLSRLLDHAFDQARAEGAWHVPLQLTIPLRRVRDTVVKGAIQFAQGQVSIRPDTPSFSRVQGTLDFSDTGFSASGLTAQFLGGPVSLNGGIGGTRPGLQMQGNAQASALQAYAGLAGMQRLKGQIPYKAVLQREKSKKYALTLDSDLVGLSLDLPPPLDKPAGQAMPLHVRWSPDNSSGMRLGIDLDNSIRVALLHRLADTDKKVPYFYAGYVGVNESAPPPPGGMNIDVRYPDIDVDRWKTVVDEFSSFLSDTAMKHEGIVLPDLQQIHVQSALIRFQGARLSQATFTATQPQPFKWQAKVSSSQTAGTIFWNEAQGKVAGSVQAKFDRLALGHDAAQGPGPAESEPAGTSDGVDDSFDIPAIDLQVDKFTLYGHPMGRLSVQGTNQASGELWKLDKLSLAAPSFQLKGSGVWSLSGADRGLVLDAQADTRDLGKYLALMGYKDLMQGGSGTMSGRIEWNNLPWAYDRSDLNGQIEVKLEKGRFNSLNSRTARLLKLLSLQSVSRLATFNWNPATLMKDGFPYDNLRGSMLVRHGVMTTQNYRVVGPVGTIVLGGEVDLNTGKLDSQAVVIPNLDVSGAAIAAGIAINPVVGIGAFLGQWLLRAPLAKALTAQYQISGNWDDPKVKEVQVKAPEKGVPTPATRQDPAGSDSDASDAQANGTENGGPAVPQGGAAGNAGKADDPAPEAKAPVIEH